MTCPPIPVMELHEQVLVELRRIVRALDLQSKRLEKIGLTGSQLQVIRVLSRHDALTANQLSREVSLSQGTVTTVLDRLETKGLICRQRSSEDRRRLVLTLTEAGREVLSRAPSLLRADFVAGFQQLEAWEQTLILSCLQRLAAMMDATPGESPQEAQVDKAREELRLWRGGSRIAGS